MFPAPGTLPSPGMGADTGAGLWHCPSGPQQSSAGRCLSTPAAQEVLVLRTDLQVHRLFSHPPSYTAHLVKILTWLFFSSKISILLISVSSLSIHWCQHLCAWAFPRRCFKIFDNQPLYHLSVAIYQTSCLYLGSWYTKSFRLYCTHFKDIH